jgi:hypothetical protein
VAFLIVIIIFALIAAIVLVVGAPLRARRAGDGGAAASAAPAREVRLAELRADREAKYREIRDAEMDYRTGKLSEQDYLELDAELRAEALRVLDALDDLGDGPASAGGDSEDGG